MAVVVAWDRLTSLAKQTAGLRARLKASGVDSDGFLNRANANMALQEALTVTRSYSVTESPAGLTRNVGTRFRVYGLGFRGLGVWGLGFRV